MDRQLVTQKASPALHSLPEMPLVCRLLRKSCVRGKVLEAHSPGGRVSAERERERERKKKGR